MSGKLNPEKWPRQELQQQLARSRTYTDFTSAVGHSDGGMVVGSTGPFAQYVGAQALREGGNAVDAAVATALAQITLCAGGWSALPASRLSSFMIQRPVRPIQSTGLSAHSGMKRRQRRFRRRRSHRGALRWCPVSLPQYMRRTSALAGSLGQTYWRRQFGSVITVSRLVTRLQQ